MGTSEHSPHGTNDPETHEKMFIWYTRTGMSCGLLMAIVGLAFLLRNLGILPGGAWSVIWPLFLIALGLSGLYWWGRQRKKGDGSLY